VWPLVQNPVDHRHSQVFRAQIQHIGLPHALPLPNRDTRERRIIGAVPVPCYDIEIDVVPDMSDQIADRPERAAGLEGRQIIVNECQDCRNGSAIRRGGNCMRVQCAMAVCSMKL
jgi:hypothetical protein